MGKKRKAASMAPPEFTKGSPVAVPVLVSGDVCVQWPGFVMVSKPGYVMVKFHGENGLYRYLPNEVIILTLDNYLSLEKKRLDVPVRVPEDVTGILLYLADKEVRRSAGINLADPYIFANNRAGIIWAYDAVALVAQRATLKHLNRIRSTNLRKYMATMTQSFDIMLLIQDNGLVGWYHLKKLEEITLEELVYSSQERSEQSESELSEQPEPDLEEACIPDLPVDLDYDIFQEEDVGEVKKKKKKIKERHKWTDEEIKELHEIFHGFIAAGKTPRIKDLEKGLKKSKAKNGHLWRLRRDNVKKKVSWIICQARKDQ